MVNRFFPISIKTKKPSFLLKEIKQKNIKYLIDVRRPMGDFSSSPHYNEHPFWIKMTLDGVGYVRATELGNPFGNKLYRKYLTKDRLLTIYALIRDMIGNIGFVCYCSEIRQTDNRCHAAWIATFLNVTDSERLERMFEKNFRKYKQTTPPRDRGNILRKVVKS